MDAEGPHGWDEEKPVLDVGSGRYEARGEAVTDADGVLLGYGVAGIGLVDLATARDVGAMDALLAAAEAEAEAEAEQPMTEDEVIEWFGDPGDDGG